jgi:hypothetical protein
LHGCVTWTVVSHQPGQPSGPGPGGLGGFSMVCELSFEIRELLLTSTTWFKKWENFFY